eukprot:jgi/Ulvmu1/634/UM010_0004.1
MPVMAELQVCSFEESMTRLKKTVYKNRVRVKEFLSDFDRLRSGTMFENFFISGLSIAGLDKKLSPQQIETIVDAYRVQVTPSLSMIDWVRFVEDVETIFTQKGLHKDPISTIPAEPEELLDKTRYRFCRRQLSQEKEEKLQLVLEGLSRKAAKRGMLVKPFFEDASRDPNSIRMINHVTPQQFKQVLNVKLALEVNQDDLDLLIEKFVSEDYGDMVNFVAFASNVDPCEDAFDPYSLGF